MTRGQARHHHARRLTRNIIVGSLEEGKGFPGPFSSERGPWADSARVDVRGGRERPGAPGAQKVTATSVENALSLLLVSTAVTT